MLSAWNLRTLAYDAPAASYGAVGWRGEHDASAHCPEDADGAWRDEGSVAEVAFAPLRARKHALLLVDDDDAAAAKTTTTGGPLTRVHAQAAAVRRSLDLTCCSFTKTKKAVWQNAMMTSKCLFFSSAARIRHATTVAIELRSKGSGIGVFPL